MGKGVEKEKETGTAKERDMERSAKKGERFKTPFGIIENGKLAEKFSKEPKKAARQYLKSDAYEGFSGEGLEKLFPYKDYGKWLNEFGLELAKLKIEGAKKEDLDGDLIILARTYEELTHFAKVLKNREDVLKNYNMFPVLSKSTEKLKDKLEKKLRSKAEKAAPNTTALLGPILASRLLARANGLEKLAKMPVSKIQILGAEKSLFRYLKDKEEGRKSKTPKYGLIFLSPYIMNAKANRGKIARLLASKIMVAARIDYFSKDDWSEKIKTEFLEEYGKLAE
ncbi:MAG: hypothetical protein ACP5E4_01855 [Candidatus Aenigmatarchaeota archaeon]